MKKNYSSAKVKNLKNRYIYYNHIMELRRIDENDLEYIPKEYRYFMKNNIAYDTLGYYNSIYFDYLEQADEKKINSVIIETFNNIKSEKFEEIKRAIIDHEIMTPLLKKARATYQIDFDRSGGDKVTHSLLHIYGSAYENTECLYILKWIIEGFHNKPLTRNFDSYKNNYGDIEKGRLLNDIIRESKSIPDFNNILKKAYNKKMRHLCFHNAAELDDEKKHIIGIEDSKIQISYKEAFNSIYALQQIHNYIRLSASTLVIEKEYIANEGVFNSATIFYEEDKSQLYLLQLFPFYEYDLNHNEQLNEIYVKEDDSYYIFYSNKNIIKIEKNSLITQWYQDKKDTHISVVAAYPDIYEEDESMFVMRTREYGDFIFGSSYEVNIIFK